MNYQEKYLKYKQKYLHLKNLINITNLKGGFNMKIYFFDDKSYISDDFINDIGFDEADTIYTLKINILRYLNDKNIIKSEKLTEIINNNKNIINVNHINIYNKSNVLLKDAEILKDNDELYFKIISDINVIPQKIQTGTIDSSLLNYGENIKNIEIEGNIYNGIGKMTIFYNPKISYIYLSKNQRTAVNICNILIKQGEFKDTKLNGQGIKKIITNIEDENGNKIIIGNDYVEGTHIVEQGIFKNDLLDGFGKINSFDKLIEGNFKNGMLNGLGKKQIIIFVNGYDTATIIEEGNFIDGMLNGLGKIMHDNGRIYTGEFKNGILIKGTIYYADGTKYDI